MKTALIVLAALAGAGLLGCLVCGVSGWLWVQDKAVEVRELGEQVQVEVAEFAASHAQADCLEEALRRADACSSPAEFMCQTKANAFLRLCLAAAAPTPGLCEGVPDAGDVWATAEWASLHCGEIGRARDPSCPQFVSAMAQYCALEAGLEPGAPGPGAPEPGALEAGAPGP